MIIAFIALRSFRTDAYRRPHIIEKSLDHADLRE